MGRTPGNLDNIFELADDNNFTLTRAIFDANCGADVCSWGNAQRRYKLRVAAATAPAAAQRPAPPPKEARKGATTQV